MVISRCASVLFGVCLILLSGMCVMHALCHDGDGAGTMTWPDGSTYVGDWKDDKGSGQGMSCAHGDES